jgi:hypothetical protein
LLSTDPFLYKVFQQIVHTRHFPPPFHSFLSPLAFPCLPSLPFLSRRSTILDARSFSLSSGRPQVHHLGEEVSRLVRESSGQRDATQRYALPQILFSCRFFTRFFCPVDFFLCRFFLRDFSSVDISSADFPPKSFRLLKIFSTRFFITFHFLSLPLSLS